MVAYAIGYSLLATREPVDTQQTFFGPHKRFDGVVVAADKDTGFAVIDFRRGRYVDVTTKPPLKAGQRVSAYLQREITVYYVDGEYKNIGFGGYEVIGEVVRARP